MALATPQGPSLLHGFKQASRFDKGLGAQLPEAYKKFWKEWKHQKPAAVHYIPKEGEWERDEVTNEIKPVQNVPIPLIDPQEANQGIWGGEAVVKGFQKRHPLKRRVPHFWVPVLRRSVVHSQVLNQHLSMVVTDRTLEKIHECRGFDHYLLKTPACDLRSTLAFKLKRKILLELLHGCPTHAGKPEHQKRLKQEFGCYLEAYTPEEIDWYGHTYMEAIKKLQAEIRAQNTVLPHKVQFRSKLIEQLRQAGIREAGSVAEPTLLKEKDADIDALAKIDSADSSSSNWLSKLNPFGKKPST